MTLTPYLDEKMEVINFIEKKMREGKADPKIRGWAMSTIVNQVAEKFGANQASLARDYFIRYYEKSKSNKKGN